MNPFGMIALFSSVFLFAKWRVSNNWRRRKSQRAYGDSDWESMTKFLNVNGQFRIIVNIKMDGIYIFASDEAITLIEDERIKNIVDKFSDIGRIILDRYFIHIESGTNQNKLREIVDACLYD